MKIQHTPEEAALYRRIAEGDIEARNEMAWRHAGLVQAVATYYAKRNPLLDMDDLIQEGRIGVIHALSKFDVDKGYRFSTYGTYWIKKFIRKYVVDNHSRGPSTQKKDTEAYLAERMSEEDTKLYSQRCIEHVSLDDHQPSGDEYAERIADDDDLVEDIVMDDIDWDRVVVALNDKSISEQQRRIVCLRYGVLGCKRHSATQVGKLVGCPTRIVIQVEQGTIDAIIKLLEE